MAVHIIRRGAVYYYHRRLPHILAGEVDRPHLFFSLSATRLAVARRLAAQCDAIVEDACMQAEAGQRPMSKQELDALLRHVVVHHGLKLDRIAAVEKSRENFDVAESKANDRMVYWAYKLLDARGYTATVRP